MKFIVAKGLSVVLTLFGVSLLAFFLIRLAPGDPVLLMMGERGADPKLYAALQAKLGLDGSLIKQYFSFLAHALQGDLGHSIVSNQPVTSELLARWPATFELGIFSVCIAICIGIPLGILAAINQNSLLDRCLMAIALGGYSMPVFWWGLVMILFFSIGLDLTPVSGRLGVIYDIEPVTGFMLIDTLLPQSYQDYGSQAFLDALHHLVLPAFVMATVPLAVFARMTRSSMLEVLSEDYIRTARAKGLSEFRIIIVHALRNALVPVISIGGVMFISIAVSGAILTETIFGLPGVGSYIVNSVYARDYPVIQGSILMIGIFVLCTNLFIDQLNQWVSQRKSE